MFFQKVFKYLKKKEISNQSGIALFMVLLSLGMLTFLVGDFAYISQVNQRISNNELDRIRAYYLAKSAFKISLLRLKAFRTLQLTVENLGDQASQLGVTPGALNQIWSFPLIFPLPSDLPDLLPSQKDSIQEFNDQSALKGEFTSLIESESSKFNLNSILSSFYIKNKNKNQNQNPESPDSEGQASNPDNPEKPKTQNPDEPQNPDDPPKAGFDKTQARQSLADYLAQIIQKKLEEDESFADKYKDFRMEDFMDEIFTWADPEYEGRSLQKNGSNTFKRAPFYHITEMAMIPSMDENFYEILTPHLTVAPSPGINVNTLNSVTLKAIFPQIQEEELKKFFEYRDNPEEDKQFVKSEDFIQYLLKNTSLFPSEQQPTAVLQEYERKGIRFVTQESSFKISIRATHKKAVSQIEAYVQFENKNQKKPKSKTQPVLPTGATFQNPALTQPKSNPSGLNISLIRFF